MSSLTYPKFTVIIATYNCCSTLEKSIDSFFNQKYPNKELIIIDGGSVDGTVDIIKKFSNKLAYWISEPDQGVYDAWNKGLRMASGDWISFLGADDIYLPNALQCYSKFIQKYSEHSFDHISSLSNLIKNNKIIRVIGSPWVWKSFKRSMTVAHVGSFHSKYFFKKYGVFDSTYKISGDYEILLRARESLKAGFFNVPTVNMGFGGISDSISVFDETMRAKINTGSRSPVLCFLEYKYSSFKFRIRKKLWY
jgi:glycosyltransferase involved in cell wall biosynthesis